MFDPDYQDLDCPKCLRRRVYADRETGFYCMSCGHLLTAGEALMLIGKSVLRPASVPNPRSGDRSLAMEIREMPPARRRAARDHIRNGTSERGHAGP